MKLHWVRSLSVLLAITALTAAIVGCNRKSFDYVDTTVADPDEKKIPWSNSGEFTYTPSADGVGNVINLSGGGWMDMYLSDDSLYLYGHLRAIQFDPATGRQTDLCTDPLCDHIDEDCPLSGMTPSHGFHVVDDKVIYYRGNYTSEGYVTQLMLYSMTDRTTKILRTLEGDTFVHTIVALEDRYFFMDLVQDEETEEYTYSLCCQIYDSGETIIMRRENNFNTALLGTDGEAFYIYDQAETALIALALDGQTELSRISVEDSQMSICKDGYLIFCVDGELWRMNLDGTDRQSLGIRDVDYFYLTDSYIYYRKIEGQKRGIETFTSYDGTHEVEMEVDLQAIYRADHEGNHQTLVWKNADENNVLSPLDYIVLGNYVYATFNYYQFDGDRVTGNGSGNLGVPYYCRIDCTTGEVYYIEMEKLNFPEYPY